MGLPRTVASFLAAFLAAFVLLGASSCAKGKGGAAKKQFYEFTTIGRADIESVVTSSGTLSVTSSVGVLAQMSGRVERLYVDFNDRVKKGQVLATINTDLLKLEAKAAQASVDKAQANYELRLLAAQNAKALFDKGLLSDYDYKTTRSTLNADKADLASAQASLEQIETEINQYAIVTSPIDGIVLDCKIEEGQSVLGGTSSTSTKLFTLAGDLSAMEIDAQVDELDIGSIETGQEVRFTVEANPGKEFAGKVKEVRLIPQTSDNVVYYDVIIAARNESGKLLPGMTASVTFIKEKRENVLAAPSAALRFTPSVLGAQEMRRALFLAGLPPDMGAQERAETIARFDEEQKARAGADKAKAEPKASITSLIGGFGPPRPAQQRRVSTGPAKRGASPGGDGAEAVKRPLWYIDEAGKLAAVMVEIGLSDESRTEIIGPADIEGRKVILKVKAE